MEIVKLLPSAPSVVLMATLKGAYAAGTDYAPGDAVSYNGGVYVMHTDAAAGTAPTDTTKWQAINSPQAYVESIDALSLVNTTDGNTLSVDQNGNVGTAVATDGAVHIENTGNTGIGLAVYTNIGATAEAPLVSINADNAAFDQYAVKVSQDGTASGIRIDVAGTLVTDNYGIDVVWSTDDTNALTGAARFYSNFAHTVATRERAVCNVVNDNASSLISAMYVRNDGAGSALYLNGTGTSEGLWVNQDANNTAIEIDHDDTGTSPSLRIIRDGNNAARIWAISIDIDNAGVGNLVGGIDFSTMDDTEPLFKIKTTDTDLSSKSPETDAEAGWFPVLVGTTTYAVPIYALS